MREPRDCPPTGTAWLANVGVVVHAAHLRQLVRVALDPAPELGDRDEDQLPRDHDLQLRLHLALKVLRLMPSDAAASRRVSV